MKHLLIVAYEYHGYHSTQGAALSRRITQVAESFNNNHWHVTVIHKDCRKECNDGIEYTICIEKNGVKRIVLSDNQVHNKFYKNRFIRKFYTLIYIILRGDRSWFFGRMLLKYYPFFCLQSPDLLISFFTPRGPMYAAHNLKKRYNFPWIADLQDPLNEGINNRIGRFFNNIWTRKILLNANRIVHVSPEWAKDDGKIITKHVDVIRHAIPQNFNLSLSNSTRKDFNILYAGSIDPELQPLKGLNNLLKSITFFKQITLVIASNESVISYFMENIDKCVNIKYVGWLDYNDYKKLVNEMDCLLVIPWNTNKRQGIPSKFYDACQFNKPIWIVGEDTGAFEILFKEWGHPNIATGDFQYQIEALEKAIKGDFSMMFNLQNCTEKVLKSDDLFHEYMKLL